MKPLRAATILTMLVVCANATEPFSLLQLRNDGSYWVSPSGQKVTAEGRVHLGDVQNGYLYGGWLYCFDRSNLMSVNLHSAEKDEILDLDKSIGPQAHPWRIGYVDEKKILFSAYKGAELRVGSGIPMTYQIYQFERASRTTAALPIGDCHDGLFSFHEDELYYTGSKGNIYRVSNGARWPTGLKGRNPVVSPDGKKLAYLKTGFLFETVMVYDICDRSSLAVRRSLGSKAFSDVLRWSANGRLIAVAGVSDVTAKPLYVVDIKQANVVAEYSSNSATNWFFVEPNPFPK